MATRVAAVPPPPAPTPTGPGNIEAERALLGALLLENRLVEELPPDFDEDHFLEPLHGRIFARIRQLVDQNRIANPITLKPLLEADPALAELGGLAYLTGLTQDPAVLLAARDLARQIRDLALLRALVRVGTELVQRATDTSSDLDPRAQVEAAEEALFRVASRGEVADGTIGFAKAAGRALAMAERAMKSGGHLSGLTTGLAGLNNKLGGLHASDLIVLAGRPGMGKTALATNIAFHCAWRHVLEEEQGSAVRNGAPVAFFSLEMSAEQLALRILAERSGINSEDLRTGRIAQRQFNDLARAAEELQRLPLYIDDTPALSIAGLRTRARRLKRQKGVGLVVVDYLQLLQGSLRAGSENRVLEISEITRGLKTLAKELDVPVLALSQLSRAVENRPDRRPQLADLRESGTIEQDADIVLFVYREEYYHALAKPEDGSDKFPAWLEKADRIAGRAEVIVAKQRHGSTGPVPLMFDKALTRFSDPAEGDWSGWSG
ncbi:MAG: replicative DNA helicase [Sphingomonadaceae bacterium]|uniref:replicative DNA helicase n=1 Tax=Thermaurantiacus sp. TaxID=2820283 RepID=UPI00298EF0CD|nr:replicative DNA helicase [Thermaurantiacus sp.]MCS6987399.1 replicative DNA helicase [Sphingomonadaceae bacterium]MDW8415319.1 replicative DNA helicase [Thermaurantiacus sp.]